MSITKVAGAFCVTLAMTAALSAQTASQNPTQQPPATASAQEHSVTVEGCLVREKDVPGRQPNTAERAGVMEDFILTNAKIVKGGHTPRPRGRPRRASRPPEPAAPPARCSRSAD